MSEKTETGKVTLRFQVELTCIRTVEAEITADSEEACIELAKSFRPGEPPEGGEDPLRRNRQHREGGRPDLRSMR